MLNRVFLVGISFSLLVAIAFLVAIVDVTVVYADDGESVTPTVTEAEDTAREQSDEANNPSESVEADDESPQKVEGTV
ncbi:MAG: hypothetical protein H8D34_12545, partial [Chloroflexi bacterium]|nr:hypothetical protein [Chloroflexota bacterium]